MKLNKYFMLGLAGLAFAACSNEDEGNDILTKGTQADFRDDFCRKLWTDKSRKRMDRGC
ncbi:hypothetical protein NXX20_02270 [Bacteroides stercoris]|nr:hypothetical protein [Bacteroides stercoris]